MPESVRNGGGWRVHAARPALAAALAELAQRATSSGPCAIEGRAAWLEIRPLRGLERCAAALGRGPLAVQQARLVWLRARAFLAPEPLAHGRLLRAGLPRAELLLTELGPAGPSLAEFLARREEALRAAVLDELACELARMQALHFRPLAACGASVRVERDSTRGRVWFLECSRGAPRSPQRDFTQGLELEAHERERCVRRFAAELSAQLPPR